MAIKVTVRQKRIVYDTTISITSFDGEIRDIVDEEADPETVLIRKVEGLAALLGCSEEKAQRLILERCELP
ncbi:hypothetical protein DBR23_02705 [Acidovorax sp. HMWF018]|uniref:hypothetical protein n=1 Tax=Acidovorax sp. HMWF018 TaxID=2056855 RepID=UPI000D3469C9|nr:hypothetical protein [Acidovorax sp. HMWF018]PTT42810.1 hypothetical protein DBR23_02705 [Acidovorax sp. HMWF018]